MTERSARVKRKTDNSIFPYAVVFPAVVILLCVIAFPALTSIFISFTDMSMRKGFSGFGFVGLANFIQVINDPEIPTVVSHTLIWTFSVLSFALMLGIAVALLLQSLGRIGNKLLIVWLLPWVMPDIAAAMIWSILLHPQIGAFNYALVWLRILKEPIAWLSEPSLALWGVVVAAIWRAFPFHMTMSYAALQTLPEELRDAAQMDGVSGWQFLRHIQLPWITPVLSTTTLLGFIWTFNWFSLIYGMTKGGPGGITQTVPIYIYKRALNFFDFSRASAFSILTLLFISVLIFVYIKNFVAKRNI